jgi:hypothetical protein
VGASPAGTISGENMAKPIKSPSELPLREQVALRFLALMVSHDPGAADPEESVRRAYAIGDAFLERARENWRADRAAKEAGGDGRNIAEAKTDEAMQAHTP